MFCTTIRFLFTRRPADGLIVTGFSSNSHNTMCVCVHKKSMVSHWWCLPHGRVHRQVHPLSINDGKVVSNALVKLSIFPRMSRLHGNRCGFVLRFEKNWKRSVACTCTVSPICSFESWLNCIMEVVIRLRRFERRRESWSKSRWIIYAWFVRTITEIIVFFSLLYNQYTLWESVHISYSNTYALHEI